MLHRTLTEHAAECFYSDERLADWLWQNLQPRPAEFSADALTTLQDRFNYLLIEGIDARYPRQHRLTDVRRLVSHTCDNSFLQSAELPWLDELRERLLQSNGDLLCYREREVQAYVRLTVGLDPTLLVGWHLARWLDDIPQPEPHDIQRIVSAQTSFFAPPHNPHKPYAEGHVHWGGVTADSIILDDLLLANPNRELVSNDNEWEQDELDRLRPLLQRARLLFPLLLDKNWQEIQLSLNTPITEVISYPDWEILEKLNHGSPTSSARWVLEQFACAMHNEHGSPNRWLWLYLYLCRLYHEPDTQPMQRAAILCFWQTVNILRRSMIMDGQGLARFAERHFKPSLKKSTSPKQANELNAKRIWSAPSDVAEIKSSPLAFKANFAKKIAKEMGKNPGFPKLQPPHIFGEDEIPLDAKAQATIHAMERWQYCGHFSRSEKKRRKIWKDAETLINNLQSKNGWGAPEFMGGTQNPNFRFQPARWFRGLDVAGDENKAKIEPFAPALRWLRRGLTAKTKEDTACTGFHFSIHAGEDYAHPASGMRHIDETVHFCEMHEGDRLGHALALGISPKDWVERQGEMIIPLDEHLDNLVWLWHHACSLSGHLPLAQQVEPLLRRRIARFWQQSRWWRIPNPMEPSEFDDGSAKFDNAVLQHATPDDLFDSWKLRRNCYHRWQELHDGEISDTKDQTALPDHEEIRKQASIAAKLYIARHIWAATDIDEPLVIVRTSNTDAPHSHTDSRRKDDLLEDVDTPAELEFMHALQDWFLTKYDQLGLIIEANPTSNVYIARLKSHSEHPIFRWTPPDETVLNDGEKHNLYGLRRGPVRVTINTDDPGVMPTTLRTEFLLLREAATELNIGRTVTERWLEELRIYGVDQFHRNHQPGFEPYDSQWRGNTNQP